MESWSMKRRSGQSLFEAAVGIMAFAAVLLVVADLAVVLLAVQVNDNACAGAARAAADGDPAQAGRRAEAALRPPAKRPSGALVSDVVLVPPVKTQITRQPLAQKDPFSEKISNPGGPVEGIVLVSTEIQVSPFFLHLVCSPNSPLKFRCSHSSAISYVMPPTSKSLAAEEEELP
jgi:hypothetical protein